MLQGAGHDFKLRKCNWASTASSSKTRYVVFVGKTARMLEISFNGNAKGKGKIRSNPIRSWSPFLILLPVCSILGIHVQRVLELVIRCRGAGSIWPAKDEPLRCEVSAIGNSFGWSRWQGRNDILVRINLTACPKLVLRDNANCILLLLTFPR